MGKRTGRIAVLGAVVTATVALGVGTAAAQSLSVSSGSGNPGSQVSITVTLSGTGVAGTQNDITFDPNNAPIAANASNKPDCTANTAIMKEGTQFAFEPPGCTGTACTSVRVLVFSLQNTDLIPDGSALYSCNVNIPSTATPGMYALTVPPDSVTLSDANGNTVNPASPPTNGTITVNGGGATNTPSGASTPTPQPTPSGPAIVGPVVSGTPGQKASVNFTLFAGGAMVAGTQNDVTFDQDAPIAANASNKPDCTANAAIMKEGTQFAFEPPGCSGAACTSIRVLVFSLQNTDVIPDGSVLYSCNVAVSATAAPGIHTLGIPTSSVTLSDANGNTIANAVGVDGSVFIGGAPPSPSATTPSGQPSTPTPQPTPSGPAIIGPVLQASPGQTVLVNFTLFSSGAMVAGTQNDVTFDQDAPIAANGSNKPDCTANAAIMKEGTQFAFEPPGCTGAACTSIRVLVFSLMNTDVIPDGSVLYSCNVAVSATAAAGIHTLGIPTSSVTLSDANGNTIANALGEDGSVFVSSGGASPSPTTPSGQPSTPTPQPTPSGPAIVGPVVQASPGQTLSVNFTLFSSGAMVAGTQNDVTFDQDAPIAANASNKPDCTANTAIMKEGTQFAFEPPGCSGAACTSIRVLVFSLMNTDVIPDGSVLYSCNVAVSATAAAGIHTLGIPTSSVTLSDANGNTIANAVGVDGSVFVPGVVGPTNTPSVGATSTPTGTPVVAPTNTPTQIIVPPTSTPTFTPIPTQPTFVPTGGVSDEDGCQIGTAGSAPTGWLILVPVAGLLFLRRRRSR